MRNPDNTERLCTQQRCVLKKLRRMPGQAETKHMKLTFPLKCMIAQKIHQRGIKEQTFLGGGLIFFRNDCVLSSR